MAMVMEIDEQALAAKFDTILPHLDERQRRLLLATEARWLGHGGISLVSRASGISRVTITTASRSWKPESSPWGAPATPAQDASG